eukprot:COSAG03_NODE_17736_length_369_cov_0.959259_1_plen_20_part_10
MKSARVVPIGRGTVHGSDAL